MKKKSTHELIGSLYNVVVDVQGEMREGFNVMNQRFEKVEVRLERMEDKVDDIQKSVNGHENRISKLEDSTRIIKTHLKLS